MTSAGWIQLLVLLVALGITAPFLGIYMARIYGDGETRIAQMFGPA